MEDFRLLGFYFVVGERPSGRLWEVGVGGCSAPPSLARWSVRFLLGRSLGMVLHLWWLERLKILEDERRGEESLLPSSNFSSARIG